MLDRILTMMLQRNRFLVSVEGGQDRISIYSRSVRLWDRATGAALNNAVAFSQGGKMLRLHLLMIRSGY